MKTKKGERENNVFATNLPSKRFWGLKDIFPIMIICCTSSVVLCLEYTFKKMLGTDIEEARIEDFYALSRN